MDNIFLTLASGYKKISLGYLELSKLIDNKSKINDVNIRVISAILAEKSKEGKIKKIKALLKKYNAEKLIEVKEEDYHRFIEDAKIL
ncbi:hypothetical protein [Clostridium saudiense]|uniref:hypothetical protein n=1 Tax=Clostridium saudiense TaxID=1414720 RepID=UPI0004B49520|nr:hypothetical protein [Clostridium saudiense]